MHSDRINIVAVVGQLTVVKYSTPRRVQEEIVRYKDKIERL